MIVPPIKALMYHILEQAQVWHKEDLKHALQNLSELYDFLDSFRFFEFYEFDTKEADSLIEEWLNTSRSP
jgi:hypothetical protein